MAVEELAALAAVWQHVPGTVLVAPLLLGTLTVNQQKGSLSLPVSIRLQRTTLGSITAPPLAVSIGQSI